jgi:hypothetical protein
MVGWISQGLAKNKGIIKTLLWLNFLENLKLMYRRSRNQKRTGGL